MVFAISSWTWWAFTVQSDETSMAVTHSVASTKGRQQESEQSYPRFQLLIFPSWFLLHFQIQPVKCLALTSQKNLNPKSINFCTYHFFLYPIVPSLCCKDDVSPEDRKPEAYPVLPYLKAVKSGYGDPGSDSEETEGLLCSKGHILDLISPVKEDFSVQRYSTCCIIAQMAWIANFA